MFATLAHRVVAMTEGTTPGVRVAENLLEVKTMLANRPAEWKQRWTQEGRQEGRLEGRLLGHREGAAALLTRQLERRFGALPEASRDRIAAAGVPDLEEWSLRLLDARTLEEVMRG
jgi:predicted transposase YdaD